MVQSLPQSDSFRILFNSPELSEVQRSGFHFFLKKGIAEELSKISCIQVKNAHFLVEIHIDAQNFQLVTPETNYRDCILKLKSYTCKLYVQAKIFFKDKISGELVYQTQPEWVLLADLPIMTKRGHFVINGSPRVVVHQVGRAPGIYFKKIVKPKKDVNNKTRFYCDIIPRKGVWVRLQISKKGEIDLKLKKSKKIRAEMVQKCLEILEKEELFSSFQTQKGFITLEKRNLDEALQLQNMGEGIPCLPTQAFGVSLKNTSRYSKKWWDAKYIFSKSGGVKVRFDRNSVNVNRPIKPLDSLRKSGFSSNLHLSMQTHPFYSLQTSLLRPLNLDNRFFSKTWQTQAFVTNSSCFLDKRKSSRVINHLIRYNVISLNSSKTKWTPYMQSQGLLAKTSLSKNKVGPKAKEETQRSRPYKAKLCTAYFLRGKSYLQEASTIFAKAEKEAFANVYTSFYRNEIEDVDTVKPSASKAELGKVKALPEKVSMSFAKASQNSKKSNEVSLLKRGDAAEAQVHGLFPKTKFLGYQSKALDRKTELSKNEVYPKPKVLEGSTATYLQTTGLQVHPQKINKVAKKTKLLKKKRIVKKTNLYGNLSKIREYLNQLFKRSDLYDLGPVGREKINTKFGISVIETQLTALDIKEAINWLSKVRAGKEDIDDIDHSQNRRVRTSSELIQTQLELGITRLKNFITKKVRNNTYKSEHVFIKPNFHKTLYGVGFNWPRNQNIIYFKNITKVPLLCFQTPYNGVCTKVLENRRFWRDKITKPYKAGRFVQGFTNVEFDADKLVKRPWFDRLHIRGESTCFVHAKRKLCIVQGPATANGLQKITMPYKAGFEQSRPRTKGHQSKALDCKTSLSKRLTKRSFVWREVFGSTSFVQVLHRNFAWLRPDTVCLFWQSRITFTSINPYFIKYKKKKDYPRWDQSNRGNLELLLQQNTIGERKFLSCKMPNSLCRSLPKPSLIQNLRLSKTGVCPKPKITQNRSLSKTGGFGRNEGVPKQSFGSQNEGIQKRSLSKTFGFGRKHSNALTLMQNNRLCNSAVSEMFSTKPINGALREFFSSSPLSQYMDQSNPLAEITHKRRISSLGIGGVSRESAGMTIRGIHPTHYGRICPIETPEGKNAGLVNSLAFYAKINKQGFIETPYYQVLKGQIQHELGFSFYSAEQESQNGFHIAPNDITQSKNKLVGTNTSTVESIPVRVADNLLDLFKKVNPYRVDCIGISPVQILSVATSLIPFLEQNDANRALMGSNMQRQAVPLMISERPLVGTGLEARVLAESGHPVQSKVSGFVSTISAHKIVVERLLDQLKIVPEHSSKRSGMLTCKNFIRGCASFQNRRFWINFVFGQLRFAAPKQPLRQLQNLNEGPRLQSVTKRYKALQSFVHPALFLHFALRCKAEFFMQSTECKAFVYSRKYVSYKARTLHASINFCMPSRTLRGVYRFDKLVNSKPLSPNETNFCNNFSKHKFTLLPVTHSITTFSRSNQETCLIQKPLIEEGDWVQKGDMISECSAGQKGELSVGKNMLIAYIPWQGYNFEDAIVISDRLVREQLYTSLHIERYTVLVNDFKDKIVDTNEWFTGNLPGIALKKITHLQKSGLPIIGTILKEGDILVGKIKYSKKKPATPHEKLVCDILGEQNFSVQNTSLYVPKGVHEARVLTYKIKKRFDKSLKNNLRPAGAPKIVHIFLGEKRNIQVGDKMSGRHGNKGIVSTILPLQNMPYLADGTPIDILLNPLGVPSRMNVGQVFECLLGLASTYLHQNFKITAFDELYGADASQSLVFLKVYQARLQSGQNWLFQVNFPGKTRLIDGRSGECFDQWVTVGRAYILKLIHMVNEKIHARAIGPYALVTQQPLKGRAHKGGQRLGEMEVWAVEGFGAAYILQELLTKKSDDSIGRKEVLKAMLPKHSNSVSLSKLRFTPSGKTGLQKTKFSDCKTNGSHSFVQNLKKNTHKNGSLLVQETSLEHKHDSLLTKQPLDDTSYAYKAELSSPSSLLVDDFSKGSVFQNASSNTLGQPDIFKVLICELQALCLDVGVYSMKTKSFQRKFLGVFE